MSKESIMQRILTVGRFDNGEDPESICASLRKSRSWLYKWILRHDDHDVSRSESKSCRPHRAANITPKAPPIHLCRF